LTHTSQIRLAHFYNLHNAKLAENQKIKPITMFSKRCAYPHDSSCGEVLFS